MISVMIEERSDCTEPEISYNVTFQQPAPSSTTICSPD